ncbi:hypothetical protein BpHYR1_016182 [Brachionus plicatilis]|uniref:Uncharacterized protein n=1 Tax=Brachionus plicatilis TaxID=10195 RepID=A0A3M7R3H6_BRAPC|nr:hypothetical protein BpHYR1_016182 [Brachionus plicatilis]
MIKDQIYFTSANKFTSTNKCEIYSKGSIFKDAWDKAANSLKAINITIFYEKVLNSDIDLYMGVTRSVLNQTSTKKDLGISMHLATIDVFLCNITKDEILCKLTFSDVKLLDLKEDCCYSSTLQRTNMSQTLEEERKRKGRREEIN